MAYAKKQTSGKALKSLIVQSDQDLRPRWNSSTRNVQSTPRFLPDTKKDYVDVQPRVNTGLRRKSETVPVSRRPNDSSAIKDRLYGSQLSLLHGRREWNSSTRLAAKQSSVLPPRKNEYSNAQARIETGLKNPKPRNTTTSRQHNDSSALKDRLFGSQRSSHLEADRPAWKPSLKVAVASALFELKALPGKKQQFTNIGSRVDSNRTKSARQNVGQPATQLHTNKPPIKKVRFAKQDCLIPNRPIWRI